MALTPDRTLPAAVAVTRKAVGITVIAGVMSRKAMIRSVSRTRSDGSCPATILQNTQSGTALIGRTVPTPTLVSVGRP